MNVVIQEIVDLLQHEIISKNVLVSIDFMKGNASLYADPIQIQQVILNLLVNAMDAMKDQPEETRKVLISTLIEKTNKILVSVSDSGSGIEASKVETVFDTFYTTKKKGMDIGFPIRKSIIENHDGHIWSSNNPKGGAVFTFTLPIR